MLAESVSTAMLVVLESLSPDERVVFVLREVFGFGHDEIAAMIGKSGDAVRQSAHRARNHVAAHRPRFTPVDPTQVAAVTGAFLAAAASGDLDTLMALMSPDVVYVADSGGKASAARRPVSGALAVARLFIGLARLGGRSRDFRVDSAVVNGLPGLLVYFDGALQGVFTISVVDGVVDRVYAMRNPDKFGGVHTTRPISR